MNLKIIKWKIKEPLSHNVKTIQKIDAKSYYQDVWNILGLSYKELGGLKSYQSANHLYKSIDLYKIVFNKNQTIYSLCNI